jgi:hypothetical protein
MNKKVFDLISTSDIIGIRVAIILILFWVGIWNLTETIVDWIEENYQIKKTNQYITLVIVLLVIIIWDPYTFEKVVG